MPAVNAFKSSETHGGLNEKQMCRWMDGSRRGKGSCRRCTVLESGLGKVWGGEVGGAVGEDGRSVMQTAAARVATGRHNRKTDASGNPI